MDFSHICDGSPVSVRSTLQLLVAQCALAFWGRRGIEPGCIQFGYSGDPARPPLYYELESEEGLDDVMSFQVECFANAGAALGGESPIMRVTIIVSRDCAAIRVPGRYALP